ncbi:homoserine O-acetyltransferase [Campylobacter blaseri]|uniref:Homoserine O-acetyltransferase n=1 Tax=Campylobacter blaseri TaxID=2042961 RepID=A0A2P8R0I5_9BACT|nr:homoserine O-acetyltransferase [Campylobacter blaseri]PSM52007.1 homoserine O-acetyltransferase [Campylobacter blaseri]PSM53792.1 homoserine O-acetyltransferase [Campylobacter blaseri]QKF85656.1 homoserine O-acetyltransferase [Campylobacter blaseri]
MKISTETEYFNEPLYLESGRILPSYNLVYETYGELNSDKSNAIVVCHALTGSHHAAGRYKDEVKSGWWDSLIGNDKAIDTKKYFVICVNILASPFGSTCPLDIDKTTGKEYRTKFPVVVISDVVNAQIKLFKRLGIKEAYAVIGGSLGGMQALCFAIEHPRFSKRVIMLASTYATRPWAIAFNKIAIEGIVNDPEFNGGYYDRYKIASEGLKGMAIGRMAGHISFLSPDSTLKKFGREYVETDGLYELKGRFQIDRYMEYNGHNFSKRFDPLCYLYIVKMMNIFDCTRHFDSLEDALSLIKSRLTLISFKGDMLFMPSEMEEIYKAMVKTDRKNMVEYFEIDSNYGHDAFLVETDKFDFYIKKALEWKK